MSNSYLKFKDTVTLSFTVIQMMLRPSMTQGLTQKHSTLWQQEGEDATVIFFIYLT